MWKGRPLRPPSSIDYLSFLVKIVQMVAQIVGNTIAATILGASLAEIPTSMHWADVIPINVIDQVFKKVLIRFFIKKPPCQMTLLKYKFEHNNIIQQFYIECKWGANLRPTIILHYSLWAQWCQWNDEGVVPYNDIPTSGAPTAYWKYARIFLLLRLVFVLFRLLRLLCCLQFFLLLLLLCHHVIDYVIYSFPFRNCLITYLLFCFQVLV